MGNWATEAPLGYDNVKINGEKKIVINAQGKMVKKAFEPKILNRKRLNNQE